MPVPTDSHFNSLTNKILHTHTHSNIKKSNLFIASEMLLCTQHILIGKLKLLAELNIRSPVVHTVYTEPTLIQCETYMTQKCPMPV